MAKLKSKSLKLKAEVLGNNPEEASERRVRFVASSPNEDRHHERVDTASLRLPLKQGGEMRAGGIPAGGVEGLVDIPLIMNHSGDVLDTIGSVRNAFFENGELIFEAGISKREIAQEMLTLLEEGHLSNAFSITMADYDYNFDTETISNAEIIEVSLVFRGANKEARLLAVKSANSEQERKEKMPEELKKEATTTNYGDEAEQVQAEAPKEEIKEVKEKEEKVEKAILPKQGFKVKATDYLNTDEAMRDFAGVLVKNATGNANDFREGWKNHLASKGISNVEVLLPHAVVSAIEAVFEKSNGIWSAVAKTGLTVYRASLEVEAFRAQGHKRGTEKKEAVSKLADRIIRAGYIYDYIALDKETLRENQDTGAVIKYVLGILPKRIVEEIERAIVIGDGRQANGEDKINSFISILDDAKDSKMITATEYTPKSGEKLYVSVIKALAEINADGEVLAITSKENLAELKLSETGNGALLTQLGGDIASTFGVKNFETPRWFNAEGVQMVLFVPSAYKTVGDNSIEAFENFALKQNKQEFLQEIYAGGALTVPYSAVVIKTAA